LGCSLLRSRSASFFELEHIRNRKAIPGTATKIFFLFLVGKIRHAVTLVLQRVLHVGWWLRCNVPMSTMLATATTNLEALWLLLVCSVAVRLGVMRHTCYHGRLLMLLHVVMIIVPQGNRFVFSRVLLLLRLLR